ncbi:MAG: dual specificity catalytic domain containing, partial [Trebouxia sp. A1-2]
RTQSYGNCPACGGKGVSSRFWCKRCGGEGRAVTPRQMRVKIPAGVDHGSVLRLNGQGDVEDFGGKRGDIMLRFVGAVEAVLYLDLSAARGRKGHLGFTHRLGNKVFSYSLPIQPQRALVQPDNFSTPDVHGGVYAIELSRTQSRLCQKALADLVPHSIRLQREALAHERYQEPVTANQLATYMLPNDVLLAATDQGLLVVVKAQHGTRQGLIEASLSKASLLLTEFGSMRQQQYIITNLGDAVALMSRPQQVHWFRKNAVHPEGGLPLVTSKSADTMHLQQEAVLDIASMCSGPEGCSLSVVLQCIAKGGLQAILKIACQKADDTITLPPQLRKALVLLLAAAPKGSELVKEVVAALEQGLAEACSLSALPELILSLLQLPDVCLAARTSGLRSSLAMYFQRHQTLGVKADVSFPMDTPQPRVTRKWPFKSLLHRTKARYQMAAQEQAPSASTGAPAYLQALYQQRLLQGASPQHHSVQRHSQEAASRHESIELGARAPSTESPRLAWQASGPWLTDEEVLQQQIKCTVIKALLQLSPLVAEEPTTDHISAEAFVYELMLEDGHALHDKGGQAELRQLCIATLASLAAQPQSISTLFASPTPKDRAAPTDLQHSQPVHRHTLLVMVFKSMREASLHKQQGTLGFPKLECYLELLAEYLTLVHDPGVTSQYLCEAAKAGEAARALRGSLGNQIAGTVYLAFFFHHLTVGPPTDKTVEAVMAFGNALVGLISAVPAASAPADSRLDRSPVWCTSGRHQSGSDMLFLPLKHQAGAADMAPGIKALQQAPDKDLACPAALPEIVSLTRVQALNLFLSGVKPPDGPCLTILQDRSRPEEQRLAALQILITFYGCNHNPIITDAHSATYACGFHFQGFADAYASEDLQFSRQHLAALQALAKHKAEVVRQHLYELCVMDFLIRNIGLEAELHLATAVPLSSTVTSADSPAPPSTDPIGATTAMTPASLSHSRYDMSHKESFGKLSSILRLPSLPPNSTRSPKISAGHPGQDSGLALAKAAKAGSARQKLPPHFVSKGDLEEDMQQLLEMDSQSEKSDSSSTPSSPPQSSRLTPKRPLLPALNLAGSARKGGPASLPTLLRLTDDKLSLGSPGGAKAASYSQATPLTPILTPVNPKHGESPSQADRLKMPKLNLPCPAGSSALQLGHNSQDLHDEGGSTQTAPAENEHGNSGNNRALYEQKRVRRFLYADAELHAQMLQLIVELLLTSKGQLDPLYCSSQDPSAQQPVSVLQQHLSWAGNASMSGPLLHWAKAIGPPAIRLLRLTCRFLFDKSMYEDKQRIARGAFAQVFTCRTPKYCADTPDLAVKITDLPTAGDNPVSQAVSEQGIVHFDLKCDNVFLHALPGVSEQEFWSPASDEPPFEVVLGDFGDSHDFSQSEQDQISMNRGTECVRSPEMLLAASSTTQAATLHAGSTHAACDVWALACLLYELVTGNLLFPSDLDWPKFFITVTDASRELLSPVVRHSLEKLPAVADVLEYTLVRDPAQRPSAKHVLHRVQQALQDPRSNLCPYRQPVTLPLTPLKPLAAPALFLTPVSTVSCNHESSMADFYSNHLAAVSEQLCLGTVSAMQQAAVLRQGSITHAVIVCSHAELRHVDSAKELSLADVLHWLLADPQLAQALKSCSAVGVQAKLIPLNVPDQPDEEIHQAASLVPQLPAVLQHVSQALQNSSSRVLVAGSAGFQGEAAIVLAAYTAQRDSQAARPAQAAIDAVVFSYAKE